MGNLLDLKLKRPSLPTFRLEPPDRQVFELPLAPRTRHWIEGEWQKATRFVGWIDSPRITRDVRTSQEDILSTRIWPNPGYRSSEVRAFHVTQWGGWNNPEGTGPLAVIGKCHERNFQTLWGTSPQAIRLPPGLCRILIIQENRVLADLDAGLPEMYNARTLYWTTDDGEDFQVRGTYQSLEETLQLSRS